MLKGIVKTYDAEKGYGFIETTENKLEKETVFVHRSALKRSGMDSVTRGQVLFFEIAEGEKGPQAVNVSANL